MTYQDQELSIHDAEPIELFLFTITASASSWLFNNTDEIVTTVDGDFKPLNIKRNDIELNQDVARMPQTISMPGDNEFLLQFREAPPNDIVELTIKRKHRNDAGIFTIWKGRVINAKFLKNADQAEVRCEPIYTSLLRPILRRIYQLNCPHVLYDTPCNVSKVGFEDGATIQTVSGSTLTSTDFLSRASGYYDGGLIEFTHPTTFLLQRRFVFSHVGDTVKVSYPFSGIEANHIIKIFPGCDHTFATCQSKFANSLNFGGQPFYPQKNPMGGEQIF